VFIVKEFKLPDIGEGVSEGEIVKWMVKEGDAIKENDPMVEVMTDKVTVEIPSPFTGKVLKILAKEGETVNVGSVIITVGEEGEAAPAPAQIEAAPPKAEAPPPPPPEPAAPGMILAAPAVRKIARDMGVDIGNVRGTGPMGRVTEEDIKQFSAKPAAPPTAAEVPPPTPALSPPAPSPPQEKVTAANEERIPLRGIRKRIAEKMHKSVTTAAHFGYADEVDMTNIVHLRERLMEMSERKKVRLTYLPFVIKAVTAALKEYPILNSSLDDERQEIVIKKYCNVGVATATDQGLVVPVIKDADKKDIWQLAKEIEQHAEEARSGKLKLEDVTGGTITITSLGAQAGVIASPVINWPEAAIISVNKIEKRPVVVNDQVVIRQMMYLSLSFDHRIVDGHVGAAFTSVMIKYLEHPALLFVGME
jgi:pyruvate dehydrogenase E2 component (dihydrolipoamide acetyltransferase)